jgi:hypothetical protein
MKGKTGAHARPHVSWLQLPPPGSGQPQSCHVPHGSSSCLLAQGSFGAITYPVAPAPATGLRTAPEPPHAPWLRLPPPGRAQGNSGAATCHMTPTPASWLKATQSYHMSHGGLYGLWAIKVNKYSLATRPSWSLSGCAYLPICYITRVASRACKTCSRWHIKC